MKKLIMKMLLFYQNIYANLINMESQRGIANTENMDYDAAEAIKGLLGEGPNKAKKDLEDWEVEEFEGKNILFYKGKNYIPNNGELQCNII